jgi:hypothetical protein
MAAPPVLSRLDDDGIAQARRWPAARVRATAACPLAPGGHPHALHIPPGGGGVGQGRTGPAGEGAIGRGLELGHRRSCSAAGAGADAPGQAPWVPRTAGAPAPGSPSAGGEVRPGRQAGRLLGHAGPPRLPLARAAMPMRQARPHDVRTMGPQDGPPVLPGGCGNAQPPARGPATHAVRPGRGPTYGCAGIGADARIRRAGARRAPPGQT